MTFDLISGLHMQIQTWHPPLRLCIHATYYVKSGLTNVLKNANKTKNMHLFSIRIANYIARCSSKRNDLAPAYISGLLKPVSETHTRSLRSSENGLLSVPRSRTALYDRSFSYSASKLWNALPQSIRTKPSLKSFKTSLKAQFQT